MRIIAGTFRGRIIETPRGCDTRPILDRVKASLFDWLGSRLAMPGQLPPINICDLFCGGGTHGIEAISRGAAHGVFVDQGADAVKCLTKNIEQLGLADRTTILKRPVGATPVRMPNNAKCDLVFFDPPYVQSHDVSKGSIIMKTLEGLADTLPVASDALMTWRHDRVDALPPEIPGGWKQIDERTWNRMTITLYGQPDA